MCICMPANLHKITIYMSKRYKHAQCWCKWKTLVSWYFLKTLLHYACCKWSLVAFTKSWLATLLAWSRGYIYILLNFPQHQTCSCAVYSIMASRDAGLHTSKPAQQTGGMGIILPHSSEHKTEGVLLHTCNIIHQDFLDVYYWYY